MRYEVLLLIGSNIIDENYLREVAILREVLLLIGSNREVLLLMRNLPFQ